MKRSNLSSIKYWLLSSILKTNSEKGYVLVIAISLLFGLAGLVLIYARTSRIEQVSNTATVDSTSGFYAAEAALNERANEITEIYQSNSVPSGTSPQSTTACFDSSISDGTGDYQCKTYSYSGGDADRSGYSATTYVVERNNGLGTVGNVPPGDDHAGLNMIEYGHSIIALAFKDSDVQQKQQQGSDEGKGAIAIIQMDIKNRLIPLFQFAAFYKDDLEIFPGPPMILNGPVHSNKHLYIGGKLQKINGEVSSVEKNLYASYNNENAKKQNNPTPVSPSNYQTQVINNFKMPSLRIGISELRLPKENFLTANGEYYQKADIRIKFKPAKTASTGNMNYLKNYIPFELTSIDRTNNITKTLTDAQLLSLLQPVMVGADIAAIPKNSGTSPKGNPIANPFHACEPIPVSNFKASITSGSGKSKTTEQFTTWWNTLSAVQKNNFREVTQAYIQEEIHSLNTPLLYNFLNIPIVNVKTTDASVLSGNKSKSFNVNLYGQFAQNTSSLGNNNKLQLAFPDNTERKKAVDFIEQMSAQEIASLPEYDSSNNAIDGTARCFVAAPIIEIGRDEADHLSPFRFYNEREDRDMRLLQINFQSLAIWNRDGIYMDTGNVLKETKGQNLIYVTASPDSSAPEGSFQRLGLAAKDTTEDGIVIHATIDKNSYPYTVGKSPYGFVVVKGQQLFGLGTTTNNTDPTGITFATDQAVYVQGDYNLREEDYHTDAATTMSSPNTSYIKRNHNYQPASFLADSFQPLSNACLTADVTVNHFEKVNCDVDGTDADILNDDKVNPTHTEFNAATLAGTDITNKYPSGSGYNGGLENYPRFLEAWSSNREWRYQGSFVSLSTPKEVSGKWGMSDVYSAPLRPWDYDTEFNEAKNLPPLTPRVAAMKQESFIRSFDQ